MKIQKWIIAAAAGLALTAVALLRPSLRSAPDDSTAGVVARAVPLRVMLTGQVEVPQQQLVSAPAGSPEQVRLLQLAPEGSCLPAGAVVAAFDDSHVRAQWDAAQEQVLEARNAARQAALDARIAAAQLSAQIGQTQAEVEQLKLQQAAAALLPAAQARKNVLQLQAAEANLARLRQAAHLLPRDQQAQSEASARNVDEAEAAASALKQEMNAFVIRSSAPGCVAIHPNTNVKQFWVGVAQPRYRAGDLMQPGQPVARVLTQTAEAVSVPVPAAVRALFALTPQVRVRFWSGPLTWFAARLAGCSQPQPDGSANCRLTVDHPPPLKTGMTADVELTATAPGAVVVPVAMVTTPADGEASVQGLRNGSRRQLPVHLIAVAAGRALLTGIRPGEHLLLPADQGSPGEP